MGVAVGAQVAKPAMRGSAVPLKHADQTARANSVDLMGVVGCVMGVRRDSPARLLANASPRTVQIRPPVQQKAVLVTLQRRELVPVVHP